MNGKASVPFDPYDLDRHASGQLLVAGGDMYGMLLKLDSSGAPDPAFGMDGVLNPMVDDALTAAKWLANGDILTIRSIVSDPPSALFRGFNRFAPDGAPIPWNDMFGSPASKALTGANIAGILEKDGTIYIAGSHPGTVVKSSEAMAFALNDDGTIKTTFGAAGIAQFGSLSAPEVLWDMALQADGSIIAMGAAGTDPVVTRLAGGAHDGGFGDGGFTKMYLPPNGVAIDGSDRILVVAVGYRVERKTKDGQPDMSFGMMGTSLLAPGTDLLVDVAVDAKQRIVVCGEEATGALVARVLDDGSLDPSFGAGGLVKGAGGALFPASAAAILPEPDGKIALAGLLGVSETFFSRLLEDGSTDASFGAGGITVVKERIRVFRLLPRKGGGYLAAGSDWSCSGAPACATIIVALGADGALDEAFGTGGLARIEEASYFQAWWGLAELPDGSIAVAGAIEENLTEKLAVWRLLSDGSLDGGGAFILPGKGRATSAIVDGDGLLVGGWAFSPGTGTDMVTLRFQL
jgi:uncharacterized delta-60 repeat protein